MFFVHGLSLTQVRPSGQALRLAQVRATCRGRGGDDLRRGRAGASDLDAWFAEFDEAVEQVPQGVGGGGPEVDGDVDGSAADEPAGRPGRDD